ncbi:MAG: trehalose-phosphatase, partial [candidate division Zixibacteria bacterium]|nr:trehalose-phosphatase [candidate division Zixibacteria bacterium]
MQLINKDLDLSRFYQSVETASHRILMLDYDGTLAPFTVERDKAYPYPGVREILSELVSSHRTRLVVISGRSVRDLVELLQLAQLPELFGSHGLERMSASGGYVSIEVDERIRHGLARIGRWIEQEGLADRTEIKPFGFAFHWRGLPEEQEAAIRGKVREKWQYTADDFGLVLREFDGGLEIRINTIDKGTAVCKIIDGAPEDTAIAYLGDDDTDEDAFGALGGR